MKRRLIILIVNTVAMMIFLERSTAAGVQPSKWVYPSYIGDLLYGSDTNGVRINDFSECGYKRGEAALPEIQYMVPSNQWIELSPLSNDRDNTTLINGALQAIGVRPTNSFGFRGVVYLDPGEYRVDGTILMTNSGVVLKGAGSSLPNGTLLRLPVARTEEAILVQSQPSDPAPISPSGPEVLMDEWLVPAGTRTFRMDRTDPFKVGDLVWLTHWATWNWIRDLDMNRLVKTWFEIDDSTGDYERQITRIEGNWITVDSPVPQTFQQLYGGGSIRLLGPDNRLANCGVEDLACVFTNNPGADNHPFPIAGVRVSDAVNIWIRNVVASGYFGACARVEGRSKFVTVADCSLYNPSISDFHDRYAFHLRAHASHVLMRDCYAEHSRHSFVVESAVPGPNVFLRATGKETEDDAGPHQRWATGLLMDEVFVEDGSAYVQTSGQINFQNRGNSGKGGDGHGWAGAFSTVWNCYAERGFRVRNPPTARNWLIGSRGGIHESMRGCWYSFIPLAPDGDCWAVGADPAGTYDQSGTNSSFVQFRSLYYAQLQQRFKAPASEFREYRLGSIDQFQYSFKWDEGPAPVEPAWLDVMRSQSGSPDGATNRFDNLRTNQYTVFTFNYPIAPNEQVIAGSITVGLRLVPGAVSGEQRLYLGNTDLFDSFDVLKWNVTSTASSVHTALIVPNQLQNGFLNVAIGPNCGVDFAVLHLQVAPVIVSSTQTLTPIDTFVRAGSYANQNFAANPELIVKEEGNSSDFSRRAFLDWNLGEVHGDLVEARVRLYCNYSGQTGNEESASLIKERGWSPNSITWNTQPTTQPPLAFWTPEPGTFTEFVVTPEVAAALLGDKRLMLAVKSAQDFGDHGDVAYASSEDANPAHRPQLILRFKNSSPTILAPPSQTAFSGQVLGPIPVLIGDAETPANSLSLIAHSLNQAVIPDQNIIIGGSSSNRELFVNVPNSFGQAPIMLTVSDGINSSNTSFVVYVNVPNQAPTISSIGNKATDEDTSLPVAFTISDPGTSPAFLTVAVSTTNTLLFPLGSIQPTNGFGGGAGSRTYLFTPAPNRFGTTIVSVAVSDGSLTTTQNFTMAVRSVEDAPTAARIDTPRGGNNLIPNTPTLVRASAFDAETNVVQFRFYRRNPIDGSEQLISETTNGQSSTTWSNPPAGDWNLYAIATDQTGLTATSPPVSITVSVPEIFPQKVLIAPLSNSVVVFWPEGVSSNALVTTTNLTSPILWSPLPSPPFLGEGAWIYELPPTERQRFFKLAD